MSDLDVTRLRLAIVRLARRQRQQSGIGLSQGLSSALAMIDVHGPLTVGELAALEQVAPPTVTRMINKLEDEGLVERENDPSDRRCVRVAITETGATRLAESRTRRDDWLARHLAALDPAERTALGAAIEPLEALLAAIDSRALDPTTLDEAAEPRP